MSQTKTKFIEDSLCLLTILAALQRSSTYAEGVTETAKRDVRDTLKKQILNLTGQYVREVDDTTHYQNVKKLADAVSKSHTKTLKDGRFRIGVAQKALNLYLKYLWCLEQIPDPPHCPFDAIVIGRLPDCSNIKWTQVDDIEKYKRLVEAARKAAKGEPLPAWELRTYAESLTRRSSGRLLRSRCSPPAR